MALVSLMMLNSCFSTTQTVIPTFYSTQTIYVTQPAEYSPINSLQTSPLTPATLQTPTDGSSNSSPANPSVPVSLGTPKSLPTPSLAVSLRLGMEVFAYDGVYLGKLELESNTDSIFSSYGQYGNTSSPNSIWCNYSIYGDDYSPTSAFGDLSSYPPILYDGSVMICYITTNRTKLPGVTPQQLLAYAYAVGWKS